MLLLNGRKTYWRFDFAGWVKDYLFCKFGARLSAERFPKWNNPKTRPFLTARPFSSPLLDECHDSATGNTD